MKVKCIFFFLCDFARAAWFAHPWYFRSDLLTEIHLSMQSVILALLIMDHPYATIPNIFKFLWCIWKSRCDCLFDRRCSLPHQVHVAALALDDQQKSHMVSPLDDRNVVTNATSPVNATTLPIQGSTLTTQLLVDGAKIYNDASFRCSKVPGLPNGSVATGIGVFLKFVQGHKNVDVQVQASAPTTTSPIQAEALALLLAAKITQLLNFAQPTFMRDNISLAN